MRMSAFTLRQPNQSSDFIGRKAELDDLTQRLQSDQCQLLTLIGPGGVGKTRLAIETASLVADTFADGVYFVDLQQMGMEDFLSAIADVLPLTLSGQDAPHTQLLSYLRDKELLLLLDSFEHLLDRAVFLSELLSQAPNVKLLVTSRETLKLYNEWLYPLNGLSVPPHGVRENIGDYDAVQLFLQRARHLRPDFALKIEHHGVTRICRLVEGVPLALELAASWTRILSCTDIADEIQRNVDFLSTNLRDVPERHRSVAAVFNPSWQRLSEDEQNAFKRLSVFRGGFRREAARVVIGTALPVILTLVDKSLLRHEAVGRYSMHDLLRQYAAKKLAQAPMNVVTHTRDLHSSYYMNLLANLTADMAGGQQLNATAQIAADFNNVRAAWQWAINQEKVSEIADAAFSLYHFCQYRSRYGEGVQMFEQAAQLLNDDILSAQPKSIQVLTFLGWFYVRLGLLGQAHAVFTRADAARLDSLPETHYAIDPALGLGLLASMQGDYDQSIRLLEQGMQRSKQVGYLLNQALGHYILTGMHLAQGKYSAAKQHAQSAYSASDQLRNRWFMASCLNRLGDVASALGDYQVATEYYEDSYTIKESFNDAEGMALALSHLGEVALQQRDIVKAQHVFQKSHDIYRQFNDKGGLATALHGLGKTAIIRNELVTARHLLERALEIAADIQYVTLTLSIIFSAGQLLVKSGHTEMATAWLDFVRQYPTASYGVKTHAEQVRAQLSDNASWNVHSWTLEEVIASVKENLKSGSEEYDDPQEALPRLSDLPEPLTERQQTILSMLAQGLTNQEIAEELVIVVGTVKAHNHSIYNKLGVDNRVQAVTRAKELGLI